jgi:hypothetical protein
MDRINEYASDNSDDDDAEGDTSNETIRLDLTTTVDKNNMVKPTPRSVSPQRAQALPSHCCPKTLSCATPTKHPRLGAQDLTDAEDEAAAAAVETVARGEALEPLKH